MTEPLREEDDQPPPYDEVLELQDRVIGRGQALSGGLSIDAWRWRIAHEWQSPLPGIAVAHTGAITFEERVWAAVLYGGEGAAVSGDALVHHMKPRGEQPPIIDVAVGAECQVQARDFFRPRRCSALDDLRHPVRSPPQLRIGPAVLHSAAWAKSDRAAEWRLASPVQQRLVTVRQLRAGLLLLPKLPRRALVRTVLDDVELGAHAQTELDFLAFLRRHGLPLPDRLQLVVRANGKRYLDGWWEKQRVAAEVDGAHHMDAIAWDEDTLRANAVVVTMRTDRVILLRVTSGNLRHAQEQLAEQFRAVLTG